MASHVCGFTREVCVRSHTTRCWTIRSHRGGNSTVSGSCLLFLSRFSFSTPYDPQLLSTSVECCSLTRERFLLSAFFRRSPRMFENASWAQDRTPHLHSQEMTWYLLGYRGGGVPKHSGGSWPFHEEGWLDGRFSVYPPGLGQFGLSLEVGNFLF